MSYYQCKNRKIRVLISIEKLKNRISKTTLISQKNWEVNRYSLKLKRKIKQKLWLKMELKKKPNLTKKLMILIKPMILKTNRLLLKIRIIIG